MMTVVLWGCISDVSHHCDQTAAKKRYKEDVWLMVCGNSPLRQEQRVSVVAEGHLLTFGRPGSRE